LASKRCPGVPGLTYCIIPNQGLIISSPHHHQRQTINIRAPPSVFSLRRERGRGRDTCFFIS
jgi:hypothetical protein